MRAHVPVGYAVFMLLVLLPPLAAGLPFLQEGVDAARTGVSADEGPATYDVAFTARLNGTRAEHSVPLILNGSAYVLLEDTGFPGLAANRIMRVDLSTAEMETLVDFGADPAQALASDGERLFVGRTAGIEAYGLDGSLLWRLEHPALAEPVLNVKCYTLAVRDGTLYAACSIQGGGPVQGWPPAQYRVYVVAVDAERGTPRWTWEKSLEDEGGSGAEPLAAAGASGALSVALGLSVIGGHALVMTLDLIGVDGSTEFQVWALDVATGGLTWSVGLERELEQFPVHSTTGERARARSQSHMPAAPTGTADEYYLRLESLHATDPATGLTRWRNDLHQGEEGIGNEGAPVHVAGNLLLATSERTLLAFDRVGKAPLWTFSLEREAWAGTSGVLLGGRLHLLSHHRDRVEEGFLNVVDVRTSRMHHRIPLPVLEYNENGVGEGYDLWSLAAGEGVLVLASMTGDFLVYGRTDASLAPAVAEVDPYPPVGEPVRLDLSPTAPGVGGAATAYRVEWGDGEVTDWQPDPRFEHTYGRAGDARVRLQARNDAGHTASEYLLLHVGGTPPQPPVELTLLQKAFSPDYQEFTLFAIGLTITASGTAIGLVRMRARRRRYARELAYLEGSYEEALQDPEAGEGVLQAAKERLRDLLLNGRLDGNQFSLLERRHSELTQALRLRTLESRFHGVPSSILGAVKRVVADGRITVSEREHLFDLIAQDRRMGAEEREALRLLIDAWYRRDASVDGRVPVTLAGPSSN